MTELSQKRPVLLKLNIPFCYKHCDFCSRDIIQGYDTNRLNMYIQAVQKELLSNAGEFADCEIQAIRIGGGTASLIQGPDLLQLFRTIKEHYTVSQDAPVTMRASMSEVNGGQIPFFRRVGITRYDFELMSIDRRDFTNLDFPNHIDWVSTASASFLHAETEKNMGFVLIYGKHDIDAAHFRHSLILTTRTHCCHIILQKCEGKDAGTDELINAQMSEARDVLPKAGFHEYQPGKWAKEGCDDIYTNLKASNIDELSFGIGAITRFDNVLSENTMDLKTYLNGSEKYEAITTRVTNYQ